MQKRTTKYIILLCSSLLIASPTLAAEQKSVNEQLLDLLKEKQILSDQEYQKFNKQLQKEKTTKFPLQYNKGLYLGSPEDKFSIKVNGRIEMDASFFENNHPSNGGFTTRRAWLTLRGTAYKYFGFKLQPDFTGGASRFQDATVEITCSPEFKFRIGQQKVPFSLDWINASKYRDFMFRALPTFNLSPSRDRGAVVCGELANKTIYYALGIMNGSHLGQNDPDKHKDLAGRLVLSPFKNTSQTALKELHFGGSFTYGRQNVTLPADSSVIWNGGRLSNPASGTTFFQFNNGVSQRGPRARYGLETSWICGPLTLNAEYMHVKLNDLYINQQRGNFDMNGYYLGLSYFITGEKQTLQRGHIGGITPINKFDPDKNHWGAFQLTARYERVNIDRNLLKRGYANSSMYTDGAEIYVGGINWYPHELFRIMLNCIHAEFDDVIMASSTPLKDEDTLQFRFQVMF